MQKLSTSTSATMQLITFSLTMALVLALAEFKMVSSQDCGPTRLPHVQSIIVDGFSELTFTYNTSFSNPLWCIGTTDAGRYGDLLKKIELINDEKTLVYRNPSPDDYNINGKMLFVLNNDLDTNHECNDLSNAGEITIIPGDGSQPIKEDAAAVLFNVTRVECPELSVPKHGTVKSSVIINGTLRAEYECDPGYELRGNRTRKCIRSSHELEGEWTGHHQPTCSPLLCDLIANDFSQSVQYSGNMTSTSNGVPYRTITEITCTSNNMVHYRVCELDPSNNSRVIWNAKMPTCAISTTELSTISEPDVNTPGSQNSTARPYPNIEIILAAGVPSIISLVFIFVLLFIITMLCKKQAKLPSRYSKESVYSIGNVGATDTLDKIPMEPSKITTVQSRNNSLRSETSEVELPTPNFCRSDSTRLTI